MIEVHQLYNTSAISAHVAEVWHMCLYNCPLGFYSLERIETGMEGPGSTEVEVRDTLGHWVGLF